VLKLLDGEIGEGDVVAVDLQSDNDQMSFAVVKVAKARSRQWSRLDLLTW
jgi:hypothetical protein